MAELVVDDPSYLPPQMGWEGVYTYKASDEWWNEETIANAQVAQVAQVEDDDGKNGRGRFL